MLDSAPQVDFLYESVDYEYIPGLRRREGTGFLTPVFFRPEVLLRYGLDDRYPVILASDTYGSVYQKGSDAHYDHMISFGINQSGTLVMWLGDIDELAIGEQHCLRAFNVPSDHDVGSEFFQGQVEVIFTKSSAEAQLLSARKSFLETVLVLRGMKLTRLDKESFEETRKVALPVAWKENLVGSVIQALHKICIEALEASTIREAVRQKYPKSQLVKLGSLKLLELWLARVEGVSDAATILSPLDVLDDLRTLFAHLLPDAKAQDLNTRCRSRLGVAGGSMQELYLKLLEKLAESYKTLHGRISAM